MGPVLIQRILSRRAERGGIYANWLAPHAVQSVLHCLSTPVAEAVKRTVLARV